jgi:hypothetical protein
MFVCLDLNSKKYILEHSYDPFVDKVAFMIRNVNVERSDYFTISIVDVENPSNMLSYKSRSNTFKDYGQISEFA